MKPDNSKQPEQKESLRVGIPMNIVRWMIYSLWFSGMLAPWLWQIIGVWGYISVSMILGHFSSQLNESIKKPDSKIP